MAIYVKNKDLLREILISKENDELTNQATKMLLLMADGVSRKFTYQNPMDAEDCKQEALMVVFKNWRSFNPVYTNAFAFYSEIIKRGFAAGWRTLYRQKGNDYKGSIRMKHYSIEGANEGKGLHNLL